jgi:NADPH:quinone reductase-like Zn-dependent oxidoreductase
MKAILYHEYGSPDVLELRDIDKPLVKDDEVLLRVHAAGHGGSEGRWIGPFGRLIRALVLSRFVSQRIVSYTGKPNYSSGPNNEDLATLKELIEAGKITPVIDSTYSLSETADALRYLEEGHARGKVVITVSGAGA